MAGKIYRGKMTFQGRRIYSVYASGPGVAKRLCFSWARINGYRVGDCAVEVVEVFT